MAQRSPAPHQHGHDLGGSRRHPDGHAGHARWRAWLHRLGHMLKPHSHDAADTVDAAMAGSRDGLRAVWVSLAILGVTAGLQAIVVAWSSSVALLGDTLHNVADALTSLPLAVAFLLGRRAATRAYTYGFGRAEDLAGIVIVAVIAASALAAGWTALDRLLDPAQVRHLPYVATAGLVGFAGNEVVAQYRIRVGRRIGSAALVADGLHARTDGFTSLGVVVAAAGVWAGWAWADPVAGLLITLAIAVVAFDAARQVYRRLMDAVDPALVDTAEITLRAVPGVRDATNLRLRWVGHRLHAEADLVVDAELSLLAAHEIAADAEHQLIHALPQLHSVTVHTDPSTWPGARHHRHLSHHRRAGPPADHARHR